MSQFGKSIAPASVRIGQVIQSPVDLEALYPGEFMRLDGRDVLRSAVSSAFLGAGNANFPAGVFTSTARTLPAAPASHAIAADGTNFLAAAAVGTSPIQASADGITWAQSISWGAGSTVNSILVAGSRFIIAGTGGDLSQNLVTTTGQTASNLANKANWTATTGGFTTGVNQALAYSASLGLTVGIPSAAAGTSIYTLADGATAWTTRTAASSQQKGAVVWTGQKFIVVPSTNAPAVLQVSSDGAAWTDQPFPIYTGSSVIGLASDGNGTVVMQVYGGGSNVSTVYLVSKDHGATWVSVTVPVGSYRVADANVSPHVTSQLWALRYVNGRFCVPDGDCKGWYFSSDGKTWAYEPIHLRGCGLAVSALAIAYKSGVYAGVYGSSTVAWTASEDTAKFRLHATPPYAQGYHTYNAGGASNYQEYVKVA